MSSESGVSTGSDPLRVVADALDTAVQATKDGVAAFSTSVQVYIQSDSKAAALAMRVLGPMAPKLAEQGAEQFLEFYNGIAEYVQKHPTKADALLAPKK